MEIYGVLKEVYSFTEEAVFVIVNALGVDILLNDIEISYYFKRRNSNIVIIVKFVSYKDKIKLYKARIRFKIVKMLSVFLRCFVFILEFKDRIFINENFIGYRRFVMG